MTQNAYENTLALFKSQDPGARRIASVAGVLAYALSRLTPPQYGQFIAWCVQLGLPTSPEEAIGTAGPEPLEAMVALIFGLVDEITQDNIHQYAINIAALTMNGDLTVGGCMRVDSDSTIDSGTVGTKVNVLANLAADNLGITGSMTILDSSSTDPDVIPQNNLALGAGVPENRGVATDGPITAGSFIVGETLTRGNGEVNYAAGLTMVYEDARLGLTMRKGVDGLRTTIGGPLYDSLWLELRPGFRGTAPNAPSAPINYSLQVDFPVTGPTTIVGDPSDIVGAQIFLRDPISGNTGARDWVSLGDTMTGSQNNTAFLTGTGLQLVYDAGTLSVRAGFTLGPLGMNRGGTSSIIEARLLLWARGGF